MTVTVTPTVDLVNSPPRVKLSVASTGETSTTITRLNPDGTTVPVRTNDGNPLALSANAGLLYDYEMPYGQAVTYSSQESPSTVSASVTVNVSRPWLVHPTVPGRSVQINRFRPGSFTTRTRALARSVVYPLGRANPIVVTDGARHGMSSSFVILGASSTEVSAVEALTADGAPLLLNVSPALGFNIGTRYISVGDISYAPVIDKVFETYFDITLPFVEIDRPAGGSAAQRALVDLTRFASIAAVNAAYSTLAAAQAGP